MILQSLAALYDALAANGTLEKPGWVPVKVSWGLEIDAGGRLTGVLPMKVEVPRGKKTAWVPQEMNLPIPPKRAVNIAPCFLGDNSSYVLGVDAKGKPERTLQCFEAFREKHHALLDASTHPAAKALLRFLDQWEPEKAAAHPLLAEYLDEICEGGNLIFLYEHQMLHEIPEIRAVWDASFSDTAEAEEMQCLVTGEMRPVQVLHPSIKGVQGAQSSGASLVSFNAPSLESYGRDGDQGRNAPVSTQAAFAYGAALNYLLADRQHHLRRGETTVVYWAENGNASYSDFFSDLMSSNTIDDAALTDALSLVAQGKNAAWKDMQLDASENFFIMGLAPNAARLSVRFFLQGAFGHLMENVARHQEDLRIVKPAFDHYNELSLWWLLNEAVNRNSHSKQGTQDEQDEQDEQDKHPLSKMVGDLARAIWQGTPYPATLYEQTQLRIRAERKVTRGRAAIIKAYLIRQNAFTQKEVLTVQLNEETTYAPYLLGRLFAVLEDLQERANPGINATIRDRYFNSACGRLPHADPPFSGASEKAAGRRAHPL